MVATTRGTKSSAPSDKRPKRDRLSIRLTAELKAQLDEAVSVSGRAQTDLVTEAIADKATSILREQRRLELSERDMAALLAAIENPPAPNDAMRRAVVRWRAHTA